MAESSYSWVQKNDEKKNSKDERPIPPPRVKKPSIGFKGVPDNLV